MPQDLKELDAWVTQTRWPHVVCPHCRDGSLDVGVLTSHEQAGSRNHRDHEAWEPEWIQGSFTGTLKCSRSVCDEFVAVAGDMKVDTRDAPDGRWYGEYDEFYRLKFAWPPLVLVEVPGGTPADVRAAVDAASACIWVDPNAAANRLRSAIELLLTHRGVRKTTINKKGKRERLTTHSRIIAFKALNHAAGEALEAAKWIGNSGSHESELSVGDVIGGAEMLGYALRRIYDRSESDLERRIRATNRAKGVPRSK